MTARVIVVEPARYRLWVANQKRLIDKAREEARQTKEGLASTEAGRGSEAPATGQSETEGSQESTGGGGG